MAKPKRVVVISDLHSGHEVGLTPPPFNPHYKTGAAAELSALRAKLWDLYSDWIKELQPIDALIVNGDCIEGKGPKSGATELLTADREKQCEMAACAIMATKARNVYMTYGTPYHVGHEEDWEKGIADEVGARKIGGHDYLDVNGLVLDYKHFIAGSTIPHGRHTAAARERLWSVLWAEHGEYPQANILIRSHVHYFSYAGGGNWLSVITPALCGLGGKYGPRQMTGTVDFGLIYFDVGPKGEWSWGWKLMRNGFLVRQEPMKL